MSVCLSFAWSACFSFGLFVSLSVCWSSCTSVGLPVSVCLLVYLSVSVPVCLSVCLSDGRSACLSLCVLVCLSVCLSFCRSVCLSLPVIPTLERNVIWPGILSFHLTCCVHSCWSFLCYTTHPKWNNSLSVFRETTCTLAKSFYCYVFEMATERIVSFSCS